MINKIIFPLLVLMAFLLNGCAQIDSTFTTKSSSNQMTSLYATFANGTGGFSPTTSAPYGDSITFQIPWYYPDGTYTTSKLDSLFITASLPNDAIMTPAFGLANLTSSKKYSLQAQNGAIQHYIITAIRKKSSAALIKSFKLNEANIDAIIVNNRVVIPYTSADLTHQTATVSLSYYASISPDPTTVHDYTNPVQYTVTADDGTQVIYTVQMGTPVKTAQGFYSATKLWFQPAGNMNYTSYTQISIAVSGNYIAIPTSNEWAANAASEIKYYNNSTGNYVGEMNVTGADGIYAIANDSVGNIVGINNLYAGENICLYKWNSVTSAPQLIARSTDWSAVSTSSGASFYGRKLSVYGNLNGNAVIMSTTDGTNAGGANRILKWVVQNGALVSQDPEVITYSKSWGYVAKAVPTGSLTTDNYFICSNLPIFIDYLNGNTNALAGSFSSNYLASNLGATPSLTYFQFNNAKYAAIIDGGVYSSAMNIFNITNTSTIGTSSSSSTYSTFRVFNGEGSSDVISTSADPNYNVTGEIAVGPVSSNGFYITVYFLATNGGVAAYQLSCIDPTKF